jgi:hydroxyethylthiazole kinase-like uncharacterized protein yjeF
MYTPETIALNAGGIRDLESTLYESVPAGSLMQKMAYAISVIAAGVLRQYRSVHGSRVVLLVGSGDNGADALFAGAHLARRGARVDALLVSDRVHESALAAFVRAGGLSHWVTADDAARAFIESADLVVDGIVGIGGLGALRRPAAELAAITHECDAYVIAVDLPSGVDCDTAMVADPRHTVMADLTVTSGCLKPGLIVSPGAEFSGQIEVVDLDLPFDGIDERQLLIRIDDRRAASWLPRPGRTAHKFSRGVVGVASGSPEYPGAAVLSTGGARAGVAGFIRYAGRASSNVSAAWPDVVCSQSVGQAGRVQCWVAGPGLGTDSEARAELAAILDVDVPIVLDADALTLLSQDARLAEQCRSRRAATILTPHLGEFARLAGRELDSDRLSHIALVSADLRAIVLLKGATTLIVAPDGPAYAVDSGPPELGTAGSGDVLAGLMGSILAAHEAVGQLQPRDAAQIAAVAAYVHGLAGQMAIAGGGTIAATHVIEHLPAAIALIRRVSDADQGSDVRS